MLRVLTLSTLFPDASRPTFGPFVERQTLGLAAHPAVELRIVSPIGMPPWPLSRHARYRGFAAVPEEEAWKGVPIYRPRFVTIPGAKGRFMAGAIVRAVAPLLRQLRATFPFDVIDAEFFFPDGPAAIELGKMFGVPVSVKARGADIHFWGTQSATARQVLNAGQEAEGLLAVAASLKADMVALGMAEEKIKVHYTGVDLSLFKAGERHAAKRELDVGGPLVISVGALIPRKRQALTIEAVAHMPGVSLALVGKGEDEAMLRAKASELGCSDRIKFLGALPHKEIARWLAAADALCLPSSSEGLANAWVEALACGTPIVITDVGGARELVDRPEAGHIVAPEALEARSALQDLIDHPRDPQAVRATAERFTWDANRDALFAHLSGLVSPARSPQSD
jgi:teichuronic acid biosynthesis glycosyltransferase TuaC